MTTKLAYEATAIELSKVQAPALKLYEFNYFFNQAIHLFVNKIYNIYDVNQQTTDDLRVLKATATLKPTLMTTTGNKALDYLRGATYYVDMPDDYLHLLNCICLFDVNQLKDCWNAGDVMVVGATKLTADSWSSVVDDVYNRPTKKRPYYYIHNQNDILLDLNNRLSKLNENLPTNTNTDKLHTYNYDIWPIFVEEAKTLYMLPSSTKTSVLSNLRNIDGITEEMKNILDDLEKDSSINLPIDIYNYIITLPYLSSGESNFSRTFEYSYKDYSTIEKPEGSRYANASRVKVEIRCGRDKSNIFSLAAVQIDYIKAPQFIRLTQEQLDSDEDISQIMEFPDYVNQEIVNELVNLIMRKTNDPSLQTHLLMTLSIARPTGQSQSAVLA